MEKNVMLYGEGEEYSVTDLKVMKSAAGYYLGHEYWDEEIGCWLPWDRCTDYYRSREEAQQALDLYNEADEVLP